MRSTNFKTENNSLRKLLGNGLFYGEFYKLNFKNLVTKRN